MILYKQYKVAADSSGCKEMRRRQLRQLCVSALFFCCLLSNFSCFKIRHSLSRYLEVTLRCLLTQCEASSRLCFFKFIPRGNGPARELCFLIALHANEIEGDSNKEENRDDETRNIKTGKFCKTQLYIP